MSPYTDADMRQLDAIAERRVFDEAFDAAHPEYRMSAEDHARNTRCRAFAKANARRFTAEAVTGFGAFA